LVGYDYLGAYRSYETGSLAFDFEPYMNREIGTVTVNVPEEKGLYILQMRLRDANGSVLHHNFTTFSVKERSGKAEQGFVSVPFAADSFSASQWSDRQWNVELGKVNAAGHGWYEYVVEIPDTEFSSAKLIIEASAKELFAKDLPEDDPRRARGSDYMRGGREDLHANPNSYAMTDDDKFPSYLEIYVNDVRCGVFKLDDDSADHRGILSWIAQPRNRQLCEAGSYGQLIEAAIPAGVLRKGTPAKIKLVVPEWCNGGLAIYGSSMGRYPVDPTIVLTK
ncbi:MAG: glycoside hydrolase family 2, partial [Bacteroidales bacterium]|nr:glycoside hydrolase family 2 [Bacteroidales bacterium]